MTEPVRPLTPTTSPQPSQLSPPLYALSTLPTPPMLPHTPPPSPSSRHENDLTIRTLSTILTYLRPLSPRPSPHPPPHPPLQHIHELDALSELLALTPTTVSISISHERFHTPPTIYLTYTGPTLPPLPGRDQPTFELTGLPVSPLATTSLIKYLHSTPHPTFHQHAAAVLHLFRKSIASKRKSTDEKNTAARTLLGYSIFRLAPKTLARFHRYPGLPEETPVTPPAFSVPPIVGLQAELEDAFARGEYPRLQAAMKEGRFYGPGTAAEFHGFLLQLLREAREGVEGLVRRFQGAEKDGGEEELWGQLLWVKHTLLLLHCMGSDASNLLVKHLRWVVPREAEVAADWVKSVLLPVDAAKRVHKCWKSYCIRLWVPKAEVVVVRGFPVAVGRMRGWREVVGEVLREKAAAAVAAVERRAGAVGEGEGGEVERLRTFLRGEGKWGEGFDGGWHPAGLLTAVKAGGGWWKGLRWIERGVGTEGGALCVVCQEGLAEVELSGSRCEGEVRVAAVPTGSCKVRRCLEDRLREVLGLLVEAEKTRGSTAMKRCGQK